MVPDRPQEPRQNLPSTSRDKFNAKPLGLVHGILVIGQGPDASSSDYYERIWIQIHANQMCPRMKVLATRCRASPQKALRWGIPCPFFEPYVRSRSHLMGIYRQKLTKSSKNDFCLRFEGPCVAPLSLSSPLHHARFYGLFTDAWRFICWQYTRTTPSAGTLHGKGVELKLCRNEVYYTACSLPPIQSFRARLPGQVNSNRARIP